MEDVETKRADGSVMVTFAVCVQLIASVTVTVNVPADKLLAVADVCVGVVFHK